MSLMTQHPHDTQDPPDTGRTAVRLTRTIPASPDRVYRAWLEPDTIQRWFGGVGHAVSSAEIDERVGGRHSVRQVDAEGHDVGGFESRILELVADRRIVLAWGFVGPDHVPDPALESLLTVELEPGPDGGTELTLVHERLDSFRAAMPEVAAKIEDGWQHALSALDTVFSS